MKGKIWLVVMAAMVLGSIQSADAGTEKALPLIPEPVKVERLSGEISIKGALYPVLLKDATPEEAASLRIFQEKATKRFNMKVEAKDDVDVCVNSLVLGSAIAACEMEGKLPGDDRDFGEEGYYLWADPESMNVYLDYTSVKGLHNGLMTLLQLLDATDGQSLPAVTINDKPRFVWRGMLLDSARSFLPPDIIKKYIDLLSELKLNVLHWHIVDDQGWRIESKIYPKLHEVGGILSNQSEKKNKALDKHGWGRNGRGYYTQEELRDIVAYAAERQVMIVPEIDVPGHTSSMIAAYPELQCSGEPLEVPGVGVGITNAICPGKESVYEFLDNLFGEIASIFPAPYVHIGGDEVWTQTWMTAPENQKLIQEHGCADNDCLQAYFTERVNKILQKHGKIMIGWDEITSYLPEGSIVQAWRNHDYAREAAEKGHDAIISPTSHCYIDYPQLTFTLKNLYTFEPLPAGLPPDLAPRILGGEVNLWAERVTLDNIDRKAFPRVLAHSEVMWSPAAARNWNDFVARLRPVKKSMKSRGVGFGVTWLDLTLRL